jgi:hypothetical protein
LPYKYTSGAAFPKGGTTSEVPFFITQPVTQKDAGKMREQRIIRKQCSKQNSASIRRKKFQKGGVTLTINSFSV